MKCFSGCATVSVLGIGGAGAGWRGKIVSWENSGTYAFIHVSPHTKEQKSVIMATAMLMIQSFLSLLSFS